MRKVAQLAVFVLVLGWCGIAAGGFQDQTPSNWVNPAHITVEKTSGSSSGQNTSNFLSNLDCRLISFRYTNSSTMTSGCFVDTSYGQMDADSNTVIFNDTDEGIRLSPYSFGDALIPWPASGNVISLSSATTGGSYVMIYKNPFLLASDQRDLTGKLTGKKLTHPPDLVLRDNRGNRVVINSKTIGFSDGGGWMVAETLSGSFIRVNLASLDVFPFAKSYGALGNPALLKTQLDITDDGQFVVLSNKESAELKVYDLENCQGTIEGLKPLQCPSHDYYSDIQQKTGPINYINRVRFINQQLISFDLIRQNSSADGKWLLAPTDHIGFGSEYLAFGDSFTSGEGAYDYILGTDSSENMCHLSSRSYPLLIANYMFSHSSAHSVACSGAVIRDITSTSDTYRGQVRHALDFRTLKQAQPSLLESIIANHLPGYIAQQRFVEYDRPRIITVSIGGNDIGFGNMVQACVSPHLSLSSSNNCFETYEDQLELEQLILRTKDKWKSVFEQLRQNAAGSTVYAIGYPSVAKIDGRCAANVHLSRTELQFVESTILFLNQVIHVAAIESQIEYVDITDALVGHRFCEAISNQTAMNGLTAGKDGGIFGIKMLGKESYHPNMLGHQLIAQHILKQTHNFATKTAARPAGPISIASGPPTNRTINKLLPMANLVTSNPDRGSTIKLTYEQSYSLKSGSKFIVRTTSASGPVIGEATTDSSGHLNADLALPDNLVGGQTIHVIGPDIVGNPTDLTQPIYIPASENDSDGDGISNVLDSCPLAINRSTDQDGDGTDDKCSGRVGAATKITQPPAGQTPTTTATAASTQLGPTSIAAIKNETKEKPNSGSPLPQQIQTHQYATLANSGGRVLSARSAWQIITDIDWQKYLIGLELMVVSSCVIGFSLMRIANIFYH